MSNSAQINLAHLLMNKGWVTHALGILSQVDDAVLNSHEKQLKNHIEGIGFNAVSNLSNFGSPLAIFGNQIMSTLHLKELSSRELKMQAFKQGVDYIDIETSSQCNRRCRYCTNATNDRLSENKFIDSEVYRKIIYQLSEINYDKEIHFVGYNEPLMHKNSILQCVRDASEMLPLATLVIFTNGDYLDSEYLVDLIKSGVKKLNISVRLAPGASYNDADILERIHKMAMKLGLSAVLSSFVKGMDINFSLVGSPIDISIFQRDYTEVGHNRGGLLDTVKFSKIRTAACSNPFKQFIIGYTGAVVPCCALVGDDLRHSSCIVGDVSVDEIFDIYAGMNYIRWRKELLNLDPMIGPCKNCNAESDTYENNDSNRYEVIKWGLNNNC